MRFRIENAIKTADCRIRDDQLYLPIELREKWDSRIELETAPSSQSGPVVFKCDKASGPACGANLNALWMNTEGTKGWAAGDHGVMLRYDGAQWKRDEAASAAGRALILVHCG